MVLVSQLKNPNVANNLTRKCINTNKACCKQKVQSALTAAV
jgi:hypothetical protein